MFLVSYIQKEDIKPKQGCGEVKIIDLCINKK